MRPSVSFFDTDAVPNMVHTLFIQLKWLRLFRLIHDMSLRHSFGSTFQGIGKIIDSFQVGDMHVPVGFGVVHSPSLALLVKTSFIDVFINEVFQVECCHVCILSCEGAIILKDMLS